MKKIFILTGLVIGLLSRPVHAGGAAAMRQRQGRMQQQQMMIQKQLLIQQQLQQKALIERRIAEQQKAIIQQKARVHHQINVHQLGAPVIQHTLSAEQAGVEEIADFDDVIASLNQSSRAWPLMVDFEAKEAVVDFFIRRHRQEGGHIQKPARQYVELLDSLVTAEPQMLQQPFAQVLRIVAVLEYDYDNGQNKDDLAQRVLGSPEAVRKNRMRLGIQ